MVQKIKPQMAVVKPAVLFGLAQIPFDALAVRLAQLRAAFGRRALGGNGLLFGCFALIVGLKLFVTPSIHCINNGLDAHAFFGKCILNMRWHYV